MKQVQVVSEEDLNLGPPDYKSSARTSRPRHLPITVLTQLVWHYLLSKQCKIKGTLWASPILLALWLT